MNTDAVASLADFAFAMPKSETLTEPSHDRSHVMRRDIAMDDAAHVIADGDRARGEAAEDLADQEDHDGDREDSRRVERSRSLLRTSSITRNSRCSASRSKSTTDTMFGWTSRELICASR